MLTVADYYSIEANDPEVSNSQASSKSFYIGGTCFGILRPKKCANYEVMQFGYFKEMENKWTCKEDTYIKISTQNLFFLKLHLTPCI